MNKLSSHLIFKNRFRLFIKTLKTQWVSIAGLSFAAYFFIYAIYQDVLDLLPGQALKASDTLWVYMIIVFLKMRNIIFATSANPPVRLYAATILYAYITPLLENRLHKRWLACLFGQFCISLLTAGFLWGFSLTNVFLYESLKLFFYLSSLCMCSWAAYHGNKRTYVFSVFIGTALSVLLITIQFYRLTFIWSAPFALSFLFLFVYVFFLQGFNLNLPKYYACMSRLDASDASFAQNDRLRMQQLSEATRPSYVRGLLYGDFHPTKRSAIFTKAVINLLRVRRGVYLLLFFLVALGWLLIKTSLFRSVPLMETPETRNVLGSLCITMAFNSFHHLQLEHAANMCAKRAMGLDLPFSNSSIQIACMKATILFTAFFTFLFAFVFSRPYLKALVFWISSVLSYAICCFIPQKEWAKKLTAPISTVILLFGTFWGFVL